MTYAERDSIREVIDGFFATGVVDEVLVVNNNAQAGTEAEVRRTDARQVFEPRQGYGYATRRGLAEATGDIVVLAEPDGTFLPEDIFKLLVYSNECDAVFGTRTTRELIWHGANMDWFLRWGNWAVAKLVEFLFNTSHLSDVGCTYRLLRRGAADHLVDRMTVDGNHAGAEIMLLDDHVGCPLRRGPGQLPAARRGLVGHRRTAHGRPRRPQHDRAHPALPAQDAAQPRAGARVRGRPLGGGRRRVTSSHFDSIATLYDDTLPAHVVEHYLRKRTRFVLEHCARGSGLDVGCGTGALAARLAGCRARDVRGRPVRGDAGGPPDAGAAASAPCTRRRPRCRSRTTASIW